MFVCYKLKKVVIFMDWKGKEIGVDFKKVIMDWMYSGILWRMLSEMLKLLKLIVIEICKKFIDMGF